MTLPSPIPPRGRAGALTLRIKRLYRPVVGRLWWLQYGEWQDSNGAVCIATGTGRRTFKVMWEESFATYMEADKRRHECGISVLEWEVA